MHSAVDNVEFSVIKLSTKLKQHLKKNKKIKVELFNQVKEGYFCLELLLG